jgi:anti-sigma factor RsiW
MSDQDNISLFGPGKGGKKPLSEEKLMAYLEGKLSAAEQHDVEEWLADEGMESDALEGLSTLRTGEAHQSVNRLNHRLRKTMHSKRKRRQLKTGHFTSIAIAIILLLAVVGYILVRMAKG